MTCPDCTRWANRNAVLERRMRFIRLATGDAVVREYRCTNALISFVGVMIEKLEENEHKGYWDRCEPAWLLARLREELEELEAAVGKGLDPEEIVREAADVANYAMMIADVAARRPT